METAIIPVRDLTVAIDFGTTCSGYAFQWREDFERNNRNVEFNTNWGDGTQLHKTKTCILLNKEKKVDSIGSLAERRYCNEVDKDPKHITGNWFFFENLKDCLYLDRFTGDKDIEDENGQHIPFRDVLSLFIGALKDHCVEYLSKKHAKACPKKTLWVLTVPAMWPDKTKKFVRDAAEASGINRKHLLLALEPECAAIYCLNLPVQQRTHMNHFGEAGNQFVTVDIGGGTLDITAVKVRKDGSLDEICSVQGAQVGGNDINNAFLQACTDVLDGTTWKDTFTDNNGTDLLKFMNEFEQKKLGIESERDEYICLSIPHRLRDKIKEGTVQLKAGAKYIQYFNIDDGKFQFKSELIREVLFKQVLGEVLEALTKVLSKEELKGVSTVVLVGGFVESHIVRDAVESQLKQQFKKLTVFSPTSPSRAVMVGAVSYGFNPLIFRSRIARATFGVRVLRSFDPKVHKEEYKKTVRGDSTVYCQNIFSIHVHKDQSVILCNDQPSRTYSPATEKQKKMRVRIFSSSEKEPMYTTDTSCKTVAEIVVHCPNASRDKEIEVTMIYGGTELTVIAKDIATGQEYKAEINFD